MLFIIVSDLDSGYFDSIAIEIGLQIYIEIDHGFFLRCS